MLRFFHTRPRRIAAAAVLTVLVAGLWLRLGPIPAELLDDRASVSTLVVDRRGVPLYEALSGEGTRSTKLTAETLPPWLVAATIAAEDRRFWSHPGVDPVALVRAVRTNLAEGSLVEGGSTISQQVAKLLLTRQTPARRRGFTAKIREAVLALRLEHRFSKREVLAMYLNLAGYGNQIIGVERASQAYFGSPASVLTPAQAAFLAGLPQRPSGFNPYRNREGALARQRTVLRRMETAKALSAEQANQARAEHLTFTRRTAPFIARHFVEMALAAAGNPRPARLETTLDAALQADLAGILQSHREMLTRHGASNVAVVVLDNATAEWLAWEGSGDYLDAARGATINGPLVPRQPGSALKPLTYALAFEEGFSPASVLPDVPAHFPTAQDGVVYSPRNYDGRYRGPLLARLALAGSENVPAVALASELGVPKLLRFLSRAGLTTLDKTAAYYGVGLTLGNAEVRLDELVAAYSAFARGGTWMRPAYVRGRPPTRRGLFEPALRRDLAVARERFRRAEAGRASEGRASESDPQQRMLVSPRTAFWITDILSDADAREYIFGRGGSLEFPFPVAAKTGTSQAYHDNWTVGYSRHVTVGVWVGNFDRTPLRHSSGVTGAGPIFHAVMLAAERRAGGGSTEFGGPPIVAAPATVESREICALSGLAANRWCPVQRHEWTASETPLLPCSWHHLSDEGPLVIWPPEYREWARRRGLQVSGNRYQVSGTKDTKVAKLNAGVRRAPLSISNPPTGATYLIDPTLRREFQTLSLRAVASKASGIDWMVNGERIGSASSDAAFDWPLAPGHHRITARDAAGHVAEATIVVR